MRQIGIFEAKTRLSKICDDVARNGETVMVTRKGKPLVRIVPVQQENIPASEVWEAWETYTASQEDCEEIQLPERTQNPYLNPFDESDT